MKKMLMACCLACALGLGAAEMTPATILSDIKSSVRSNWRKVADRSQDIGELREERKSLPDRSFWFFTKDKTDQDKKIRAELKRVRELLLSTNAQKILEQVDRIDVQIAELNKQISLANEDLTLSPEKKDEIEAKIKKLTDKRSALESKRRVEAQKVCAELRALGLNVSGEAAENCLFTVNFGELIDGVIVAKNVAAVVDNLRTLMASGDVGAIRRYYGMYLVMVDVQIICYEDYLEKSKNGAWRQGINQIRMDAAKARDAALANAMDDTFTSEQRQIFRHNAEINESTFKAAEAYQSVLDAHESVIEQKLGIAEKMRKVVDSSYETINLAGDLIRLAKANQDAFDSLLKLDLPPIQMFNDATVQQEFMAITKKLKE